MIDRIGDNLGNYRLLRQLGQGSFATVYLGEHRYLRRVAALKFLHVTLTNIQAANFLEEARLLAGLRHPAIVHVLEFFMQEETPVLVMDYASGGTLRQHYPPGSQLPLPAVVQHVKQIADALHYAHTHHIIHRDIKPENLLLSIEGKLLLSDFGLALSAPSPEQLSTQEIAGTPAYMAPEQLRGKPTFASDQYALGILTYEWLSGKRPFEGSYWDILHQHFYQPPPSLHHECPELPEAVSTVVLRTLAKEPQDRFSSIQEYAYALEKAAREDDRELEADRQKTVPIKKIALSSSSIPPPETHTYIQYKNKVFLSASPADRGFVAHLQDDLTEKGIAISPGSPEQADILRHAIGMASLVLVIVSLHTRTSRIIKEHLRLATMYQRRIIFVWAAGNELAALLLDVSEKHIPADVIDARNERYTKAVEEIAKCCTEYTTQTFPVEAFDTAIREEPRNPYRGLCAFTKDNSTDFFGRDALISQLLIAIENVVSVPGTVGRSWNTHLLTIIGPSGSGKSSVVMAGLLPRLLQGAIPGSASWIYPDPFVPGIHPIESLAVVMGKHLSGQSLKSIRECLMNDSTRGLYELSKRLCTQSQQKVVLVIDQFEELFTLTSSEIERKQFLELIVTAATQSGSSAVLLLTLRADFYDRLLKYGETGRVLQQQQYVVLPMETYELRAIIEQPATLPGVQLFLEETLVGDLLYETQDQIGALPLLEFTLDLLFQLREGSWLTQKAYQQIGRVRGALAKHAEATYGALPDDEHRSLAKNLFLRLIKPGQTEQDTTRRRVTHAELILSNDKETSRLQAVTEAFISARLLTTNKVDEIATIEISHEILIREWQRLAIWLDEARENIHFQQSLSEDVVQWEQRDKPQDRLYRGTQLQEARAWARRTLPSRQEAAFLKASTGYQRRSLSQSIALSLLLVLMLGIAIRLFLVPHVPPPTLVTTLSEDGPGSLQQAIAVAKPGDTITFADGLRGTIILKDGNLDIAKNLTIRGPGADSITISSPKGSYEYGSGINILSGVIALISGLSLNSINGGTSSASVINSGILTLTNCIIAHNSGSGIENEGELTLVNTIVSFNGNALHSSELGAIFNASKGILRLKNSIVSNNGGDEVGGIDNRGKLIVSNSAIIHNVGQLERGVGGFQGDGGIYNEGGTASFQNSTIAENTASFQGGGIGLNGGTVDFIFSTIYGNTAGNEGGGIWNRQTNTAFSKNSGHVEITNTLVADNSAPAQPDIAGEVLSHGHNLIQQSGGITFAEPAKEHASDLSGANFSHLGIDPTLAMLPIAESNNTYTFIHVLFKGSPLIDLIPLNDCTIAGITTDQRGIKRPQGKGCDIGAYEYISGT